jgi:hypothetical protein
MYQPPNYPPGSGQPPYPSNDPTWSGYSPPVPPRPQRRNPWRWYRRRHPILQVGIGCLALIVLALTGLFCSAFVAVAIHGVPTPTPGSQVVATSLPTHVAKASPTATSASTPRPTAPLPPRVPTATPTHPAGPAMLGSGIGTFTAAYGPPNGHSQPASGLYHYRTYPGQNIDFLIVMTDTADAGYTTIAESINVQAPDSGWSMDYASQQCAVFLPSDASYQSSVPVANGPALDKIYFSQTLAGQFPASAFVDASQNPVQPGTFDVQYLYTDASQTLVAGCTLQIGEQQT